MSTMNQNLPPVNNRFAALTAEECVYLAFLDLDRPADGIESDPELWGPEADAYVWEPTLPELAEAAALFSDSDGWCGPDDLSPSERDFEAAETELAYQLDAFPEGGAL